MTYAQNALVNSHTILNSGIAKSIPYYQILTFARLKPDFDFCKGNKIYSKVQGFLTLEIKNSNIKPSISRILNIKVLWS